VAKSCREHGTWLTSLAVLAVLVSGCTGAQDSGAAAAARDFVAAVHGGDGELACALLSPETRSQLEESSKNPCADAILGEDVQGGSVVHVSVFENMAQVRFSSEVVFLARFDKGWLVTATACRPVPDQPYDCSIQAG
jgi:hypothetical protein